MKTKEEYDKIEEELEEIRCQEVDLGHRKIELEKQFSE